MNMIVNSKLAAVLLAVLIIPALARAQPSAPGAPQDEGAPPPPPPMAHARGGSDTFFYVATDDDNAITMGPDLDLDLDYDMDLAPELPMGPGPELGLAISRGIGMGMGMAHFGGSDMGLGRALNDPKMKEQLGITPEQESKIRQEIFSFRKSQILSRAELQVKRLELRSLMEAENPDRAAINKSLEETSAAQLKIEKAGIDHQLAMRSMLTAEQREKLKKMSAEVPQHFGPVEVHRTKGVAHGGGDVFYMRTPRVEKRVIVHSGDEITPPPPPSKPEAPKQ